MVHYCGLSAVNCAICHAAPRVNEGQNLKISLLKSLLAGNSARERFAGDSIHRQRINRTNCLQRNFTADSHLLANKRVFGFERDRRAISVSDHGQEIR